MHSNDTNNINTQICANDKNNIIFKELSYQITGLCFAIHNELGRYSRERQYGDALESKLEDIKISFKREYNKKATGNVIDFLIENKVVVELKAKDFITRDDYYQVQRYLQSTGVKLGLLVNFRSKYLKPIRIIKIDTEKKTKFV